MEKPQPQQPYYFTFMQRQEDLKNNYVKITGTFLEARNKMASLFNDQWAFQYDEDDFLPQIDRFHLTPLHEIDLTKKETSNDQNIPQ